MRTSVYFLFRLRPDADSESGLDPGDGSFQEYFYAFLDGLDDPLADEVFTEVSGHLKNENAIWMFTKLISLVKLY